VDITASLTGMPYTVSATASADASAASADIHEGFRQTPSMRKSTTIGIAATRAERARLPPTGS
jgi:hypothetical protein